MNAVTEKEASTKWCPFGRIGHVNGSTCNSPALNDPDLMQTCVGSRCMAWRWSYIASVRTMSQSGYECSETPPPRSPFVPQSWNWNAMGHEEGEACWCEPEEERRARNVGYCSLAGRPE